jgi:hypothetical protein
MSREDKGRRSTSKRSSASPKSQGGGSGRARGKAASGTGGTKRKSKHVTSGETVPADLLDPEVLAGHDLLGRTSVRDGALSGVSGLNDDEVASSVGRRNNPPLVEEAGTEDGGLTLSGGAAGGARGNAGTSDSGAGGPLGESVGPGEYKATSRFDYDHGTVDENS